MDWRNQLNRMVDEKVHSVGGQSSAIVPGQWLACALAPMFWAEFDY